jgi:hypothetical protein
MMPHVKVKVPKGSKVIVSVPALIGRNFIPATPGEMDRKAITSVKSAAIGKKFGI